MSTDQKLTQLASLAALTATDAFYVVDDVAGTPTEKQIAASVIQTYVLTSGTVVTSLTFPPSGLKIKDAAGDHALTVSMQTDLGANRTLNLYTQNADTNLSLQGHFTVEAGSVINQDVTSDASPTFAGITINPGSFYMTDPDVGHPVTDIAGTTVYSLMGSLSGTAGGVYHRCLSDDVGASAYLLLGIMGVASPTAGIPVIKFRADKSNGATGVAALAATEMAFQWTTNATVLASMLGNGNFGLGVASPLAKLDINDGAVYFTDADVAQPATAVVGATVWGRLSTLSGTAGGLSITGLTDNDSSALQFIGIIGASNPADNTPAIKYTAYKSDGSNSIAAVGADETAHQFTNGSTALVTILGDGDTGYGTVNPLSKVHVYGGASGQTPTAGSLVCFEANANTYLSFLTTSANQAGLLFGDEAGAAVGQIVYSHSTNIMTFEAATSYSFKVGATPYATLSASLFTFPNLGTNGTSAATTLGSVIKKMAIYNASGGLLGYVPIYDTIT